jgi:AraC family transcriptional regulator
MNAYTKRLARVSKHIQAHLDDTIDLNTLSEIANLSPYHFHRVYHAVNGKTVANTVKRLRMSRAAADLIRTSLPIEKIAERAGYSTVQAFTRTFKSEFGMPPVQYKKYGSHTVFEKPIEQAVTLSNTVRIVETSVMTGVMLEHSGSYMMIEHAFNRLMLWAKENNLQYQSVLGIYYDDPFAVAEKDLRSSACLILESVVEPPAPMQVLHLPAMRCAVLRHRGPYADMRLAYMWLYGQWLPQAGVEPADAPVFEIYLNQPQDTAPTELLVDIYLPIRE